MKIKTMIVSVFLMVLSLTLVLTSKTISVSANTSNNINKLSVIAVSEIFVRPDTAKLSISVEVTDKDLLTAHDENSKRINEISKTLTSLGIHTENIKTSNFSSYKDYEYFNNMRIFLGYKITNEIEFTTKDLTNLNSIISQLIEIETNNGTITIKIK